MEQLSIEEKAKRYDKAIEKLRSLHDNYDTVSTLIDIKKELEEMFSELAESEDERIRKAIKKALQVRCYGSRIISDEPVTLKEAIAWLEKQGNLMKALQISNARIGELIEKNYYLKEQLEKQGEQNLADKIKPKFKVGDWVVRGETIAQILDVQEQYYVGLDIDGNDFTSSRFLSDDKIHHWTIQDAKDGDVLANTHGAIFINAGGNGGGTMDCYCYLSVQNEFCIEEHKTGSWLYKTDIKPATKEQRDLLFQKMKEAGYEWDAEKKELKKIERKSAWSEEDERKLQLLIAMCDETKGDSVTYSTMYREMEELKTWLKSLKYRYTWKPSDEQMHTLEHYIHTLICTKYKESLFELYLDLKKLREK